MSKDEKQNPEDKIQDQSKSQFNKKRGTKVDHDTLSQNSKEDIIEKNKNNKARDNIQGLF